MAGAEIDWCAKKGVWMPSGHCEGGHRYQRQARQHVPEFLRRTAGYNRGVCVQAGGHVGFYPQALALSYEAVLTFEPHPGNYRALVGNATRSNVHAYRGALGHNTTWGAHGLHEHGHNTGGHHIEVEKAPDLEQGVAMFAVDDLGLPRLDALVLDMEGAELLALQGAARSIERWRPVMLLEERGHIEKKVGVGSTTQLHERLEGMGYRPGDWVGHDRIWWPA